MSASFAIFFQLIFVFIVCIVLAIIGCLITYFVSKKTKRKRKLLFVFLAPFVGLFTLYFCALLGSIIVSGIKNIDIGIGDSWYVPISQKCELHFIDITDQGFISKNNEVVISEIVNIEQINDVFIGSTLDKKYFKYNENSNSLTYFKSKDELAKILNTKINLKNVFDFYIEKRNEIAGTWLIIVGIISLAISIGSVFILRMVVMNFVFINIFIRRL